LNLHFVDNSKAFLKLLQWIAFHPSLKIVELSYGESTEYREKVNVKGEVNTKGEGKTEVKAKAESEINKKTEVEMNEAAQFGAFLQLIQRNGLLKEFTFNYPRMICSAEMQKALFLALKGNTSLERLELSQQFRLLPEAVPSLCEVLVHNETLQEFIPPPFCDALRTNTADCLDATLQLLRALVKNKGIRNLKWKQSFLMEHMINVNPSLSNIEVIKLIAEVVRIHPNLQLMHAICIDNPDNFTEFSSALIDNPSLTDLSIQSFSCNKAGAEHLNTAFSKALLRLTHLELEGNCLPIIDGLASLLQSTKSLEVFYLARSHLDNSAAKKLIAALTVNKTVQDFRIGSADFAVDASISDIESIGVPNLVLQNTTLRRLSIRDYYLYNRNRTLSYASLVPSLQHNNTLEYLAIDKLPAREISIILKAIQHNSNLRDLYLCCTVDEKEIHESIITSKVAQELFSKNKTLECLRLEAYDTHKKQLPNDSPALKEASEIFAFCKRNKKLQARLTKHYATLSVVIRSLVANSESLLKWSILPLVEQIHSLGAFEYDDIVPKFELTEAFTKTLYFRNRTKPSTDLTTSKERPSIKINEIIEEACDDNLKSNTIVRMKD